MPSSKEFAQEVFELAATIVSYETGKSGQNGRCDCIGLVMGAMADLAHANYPLHSSNYFARYEMQTLLPMNAGALRPGHLVYKAREDTGELNDRYKPGGRYYVPGDLLDYYHVGVVTDTSPLEITHCTKSQNANGIVRDESAKGWTHYGELRRVQYAGEGATDMSYTAYVTAASGSTVNLRKRPDGDAPLVERVSLGAVVTVHEEAEGWAQVETPKGNTGYMMTKFLKKLENADDEDASESTQKDQQEAKLTVFEEAVLDRLDRILEAVKGQQEGVG